MGFFRENRARFSIRTLGGETMRRELLPVVLLVALLTGGCGVEDYNIVVKNVGKQKVDKAHVVYGDFHSVGGVLPPGIYVGHGNPEYPIPTTATVEWRTEDGQMHRQEVEVRKLIPKGFRGDIQFEIADDNTVAVRVIPREKIRY
jgi:hypothetical protein